MSQKSRPTDLRRFNNNGGGAPMPTKRIRASCGIDWSQLIMDLEAAGYTQRAMAAACGFPDVDRSLAEDGGGKYWINRLKNVPGTQPKFHNGAMLLGLWAQVFSRPPSEAPRDKPAEHQNTDQAVHAVVRFIAESQQGPGED